MTLYYILFLLQLPKSKQIQGLHMYIEKISIHELLQVLTVKDEVINIHNFNLLTKSYLAKFRHFYRVIKIIDNYISGYKILAGRINP